MIYNKLQNLVSANDISILDCNFGIFSSEIDTINNLQSSLKDFFPYGKDFDNAGRDVKVETTNDPGQLASNNGVIKFKETFFSNTVLNMTYHEGLRYQGDHSIIFYETKINPGTIFYLEDPSYFKDNNGDYVSYTENKIGRAFIYMTMPYVMGYDISINSKTNEYVFTASKSFKKLSSRIIGETGLTNWQPFYKDNKAPLPLNIYRIEVDTNRPLYVSDKCIYINKKFIKSRSFSDSNGNLIEGNLPSPTDRRFQVKFFIKEDSNGNLSSDGTCYSPIEVDYTLSTTRLEDLNNDDNVDYIAVNLPDYSDENLNWLLTNGAITIY
jgi:hypothetical protein